METINGGKTAGEQKRNFLLFFWVHLENTKRYIHSLQHQLFKIPAFLWASTIHIIRGKGKKSAGPLWFEFSLRCYCRTLKEREIRFQTGESLGWRACCSPPRTNGHERVRRRESLGSQGTGSGEIKRGGSWEEKDVKSEKTGCECSSSVIDCGSPEPLRSTFCRDVFILLETQRAAPFNSDYSGFDKHAICRTGSCYMPYDAASVSACWDSAL